MAKLTDTQLVILSAAERDGGAVLPLPKSLKINKAAAARTIKSLTNRSLIFEHLLRLGSATGHRLYGC